MHKTGTPWPVATRVSYIVAFEELRWRHRGRERRRLLPPGGVVVDDALLELHSRLGEVTPRPLAGGSLAQSVEDDHGHWWLTRWSAASRFPVV